MKKIIAFIFILFLLNSKTMVYGAVPCSDVIKDSNNSPVQNAQVEVHMAGLPDIVAKTTTNASGNYSFDTPQGFGGGPGQVKQVIYSKDEYQSQIFNTINKPNNHCPGAIVLLATAPANQPGYACNPDQGCIPVLSNSQYSNQQACTPDCQKFIYNSNSNNCNFPDPNNQFHSQSIECSKSKSSGSLPPATPKTPEPTPPLPPCEKGFDKTGTLTTDRSQIKSCSTIDTALGFIDTDPAGFVKSIFGIVLSLAGGVALILIMISGYRLMASQGNPEKVKEAQESLTSAIVGLLFIIFSITILKIIGVDILHIPGFN